MYNKKDIQDAIVFLQMANNSVKKIRVDGAIGARSEDDCGLCCSSYGGGKAKYEAKNSLTSK